MGLVRHTGSGVTLDSLDLDRRLLLLKGDDGLEYALSVRDAFTTNDTPLLSIFTSNNKPSGSYIGDGNRGRVLELNSNVAAYGCVMIITCKANNTCVIATRNGSFVCDSGGVTFELTSESVGFRGNGVVIWSNTGAFNYSGDTYEYFVL